MQYTPNDPVVHAIKMQQPDLAKFFIEQGFSYDKQYREDYPFPCNACEDCKDYYFGGPGGNCENPEYKQKDISAEFISGMEEYNDLNKFIKEIQKSIG